VQCSFKKLCIDSTPQRLEPFLEIKLDSKKIPIDEKFNNFKDVVPLSVC